MTTSASSSNFTSIVRTGTAAPTITLPTAVPAGATIVLGWLNRSDATTDISSISDDVNGTWTAAPQNISDSTVCAMAYLLSAAAGTPVVTVNLSASINSQLAVGWFTSDAGSLTFDAFSTIRVAGGNETDVNSNTVAAAGAGGIIGVCVFNNSQADPEPSMDGAGESKLTANATGATRLHMYFEAYASAGTYGFETTVDNATTRFHVGAFLEPSAGDPEGSLIQGKLVRGGLLLGGVLTR